MSPQVQVSHRMPPELLARIDDQRGLMSRNLWMNLVLARALDERSFQLAAGSEAER